MRERRNELKSEVNEVARVTITEVIPEAIVRSSLHRYAPLGDS